MLGRLDTTLLLGNIDEIACFDHGWWHFCRITNYEIVDVVVVDDVGDCTRCLLHRLLVAGKTTVLFHVRD